MTTPSVLIALTAATVIAGCGLFDREPESPLEDAGELVTVEALELRAETAVHRLLDQRHDVVEAEDLDLLHAPFDLLVDGRAAGEPLDVLAQRLAEAHVRTPAPPAPRGADPPPDPGRAAR